MTIALGILAADGGVVIGADTLESTGYLGNAKVGCHKIITRMIPAQERACSATGAGWGGHIDSLNQELTDNFILVPKRADIERRFREKVRKFYSAHILPANVYQPGERPEVEIIVGMSWKEQEPMLLATERSTLRRCKHIVTVAAGRAHASYLLNRLLPSKQATTTGLAAFMAAYVIYHVKGYVEGCGMGTHITVLKAGQAMFLRNTLAS